MVTWLPPVAVYMNLNCNRYGSAQVRKLREEIIDLADIYLTPLDITSCGNGMDGDGRGFSESEVLTHILPNRAAGRYGLDGVDSFTDCHARFCACNYALVVE